MNTSLTSKFQGKVLIIGGGIAGPALALFLKKAGIACTVYEAYKYKEGVGGGLGLAPNGMNILDSLGLAEKVISRGTPALENLFYNQRGRLLARFSNGTIQKYGQIGVSIMRPALYDVMTEEMQAQGVHVEYNKQLTNITTESDRVIAHFADGTQAEGTILIGADGIHSQTRKVTWPDGPQPAYVGIVGVGGTVAAADLPPMSEKEKQAFSFTFGAKGFFGYCGAGNGDMMWWSNLAREKELSPAELSEISVEEVKKEMLDIYRSYHSPIAAMIEHTQPPVKVNISDIQSLPTWHKGRVLLIGDAAHAVSPNAGQGVSMALEDTLYLAKLLRDSGSSYESIFELFEQGRKPRVEKIVAEGRKRGSDKQQANFFQALLRDVMLTIFVNLFGEKSMDWLYSYKLDWEDTTSPAVLAA